MSSSSEDQLNSLPPRTPTTRSSSPTTRSGSLWTCTQTKGITGTSAEKRDDFQRLLADCRRGRVDKILVKSSSRFARNKGVPGGRPGARLWESGCASRSRASTPLSWPESFSPPSSP
ncbi:MAG: recombinase family protein [Hydrogeniiclostridium mannosilyticum]